jgi:hypothetical protein
MMFLRFIDILLRSIILNAMLMILAVCYFFLFTDSLFVREKYVTEPLLVMAVIINCVHWITEICWIILNPDKHDDF